MPSPFEHNIPAASSGAGAPGTQELSYAGLSAGAETGLGAVNGTPGTGMDVASAAAAKASAEATAFAGKAAFGVGHAAIGNAAVGHAALGTSAIANAAVMPGAEPVSPIIQLIMRMPGAMGLANSFFEWLTHFFAPGGHDLLGGLDPSILHMDIGEHLNALTHLADGGDEIAGALSEMAGDTPLTNGFQQMGHSFSDGLSQTGATVSEHFMPNPADVGAGPDLAHAQFESAGSGMDGALAGPSMSGNSPTGGFLAGSQRLFSDSLGGGGNQFTSITSNTSVPVTGSAVPTAAAPEVQPNLSAPAATDATAASAPTTSAGADFTQKVGPSSFGEQYAKDNLLASDTPTYRPTSGNYYGGDNAAGGDVTPLKAKQLTFEDIRKGIVGDHGKRLIDQIAGKKPDHLASSYSPKFGTPRVASSSHVMDGISHKTALPKAYSSAPAPHHVEHAAPAHSHTEIAQSQPKAEATTDASTQQGATDQTTVQEAGDQTTPGEYTVEKGDSLWNIAEKQLGDGARWTEIYKLNSDVVGTNPDLIFSGTHLRLPGVGSDSLISDAGKYMVKPGDNLWDIAKHNLGDANKWTDIYKANADTIGGNPRLILPGQQLSMPGANIAQSAVSSPVASAAGVPGVDAAAQAAPQQMAMQTSGMTPGAMPTAPIEQTAITPSMPAPSVSFTQAEGIPVSPDGVIKVAPQQPLQMGPGAAGAATLSTNTSSLVPTSMAPDLSFLDKKPGA